MGRGSDQGDWATIRPVLGAIAVAVFFWLRLGGGCDRIRGPSAATLYNKVEAGMTPEQVISLCGEPESRSVTETGPVSIAYTTVPGTRYEMWYYQGMKMSVMFQDGYVVNKSLY